MAEFAESQKVVASDAAAGDWFGRSVAIDGDTMIVGAPRCGNGAFTVAGAAYVYVLSGGTWTEQQIIVPADPATNDTFGWSVAISGDTVIIGSKADDDGGAQSGSAYVFTRSAGVWTLEQKLTADDAATVDEYGYSVAIDGDTAVVGAWQTRNGDAFYNGAAYVLTRTLGVWTQQQKINLAAEPNHVYFGCSVALDGDNLLVGACAASSQGSAHVYTRAAGVWTLEQSFTASDIAASDQFGWSVALDGDVAIVGSNLDDDDGASSGSAYVFTRAAAVWTEAQKLTSSDAAAADEFGYSVAIDGTRVLVGARGRDPGSTGGVYVFQQAGATWNEMQILTPSVASASAQFGFSVSLSWLTAAIGAYNDDIVGADDGSAFVFTAPNSDALFFGCNF